MKRLICEMCGSTDLLKQDGVFVCQSCGCKYSVEEAKKMMVEGVVEVTGTVKLDDSDQIDNLITNAKRAFDDGRFDQAQKFYAEILVKQPNNVEAVFYEGLSIGWQSNTSRAHMTTTVGAAKRALELASTDNNCDYKSFAIEVTVHTCALGAALINLYCENIGEKIEAIEKDLKSFMKRMEDSARYGTRSQYDTMKEIGDDKLKRMNDNLALLQNNNDNVIVAILGLYEEIYKQIKGTEKCSDERFIQCLIAPLSDKITREATSSAVKSRIIKVKRNYAYLQECAAKNAQKNRINAYWAEHSVERDELETEKSTLEKRLESLEGQYNEIKSKRHNIDNLRQERDKKLPEEIECEKQREYIDELERKKNACGIFKGREKKELQAQIEQEQIKLESMEVNAATAKEIHRENLNKQIAEAKNLGQDIIDEYEKIERRIAEINNELTKDREISKNKAKQQKKCFVEQWRYHENGFHKPFWKWN